MRKVILNGCYGGYRWSIKGVYAVLKKKDIAVKFMATVYPQSGEPEDVELSESEFFRIVRSIKGDSECGLYGLYVSDLHFEDNNGNCYYEHSINRTDPVAIEVLETLGSEYCSSDCSELYVDEYDEELFDWGIDEYDGVENLKLIPLIDEKRIRSCKSVDEIVDLLKRTHVIK